jgi:prepilin-type N-terminal cleavage/methylation domain-containing protein
MELSGKWAAARHAGRRRRRHRTQLGLTLIELLVGLAILATIVGSLAGAFEIGLKILAPGNAQARLTGSHDLLAFEQQIGADVARAVCLAAPGQTAVPSGGCQLQGKSTSTCGGGSLLCLAYYVPGSTTCHNITYSQLPGNVLARRDSNTGVTARFTTGGLTMTASWTASVTTNNGYQWTNQVVVAVTQMGTLGAPTSNPAAATYRIVPLIADPASPVVSGGGTSPC